MGKFIISKKLRSQLEKRGHQFKSHSDTEVLLKSYEEWGENCVDHLRGMFAFAVWDGNNDTLSLFRDRLGIKPTYYYHKDGFFAFSSEFKALLKLERPLELSQSMIDEYVKFPYLFDKTKTLVDNIYKLPPGHKLKFRNSTISISPFWDLDNYPAQDVPSTYEECVEKLDEILTESIKLRLVADVPIGIMLSGGLDSSYISAVANNINKDPVHTFTIGLEHHLDERKYAKVVADHIGSKHQELLIRNEGVFDELPEISKIYDDLTTSDGGIISVYLMCKTIKEMGIKVLLLGEGADEIFGGYTWFGMSQYPFKVLPTQMRTWLYYHGFAKLSLRKESKGAVNELNSLIDQYESNDLFKKYSRYEIKYQLPNNYLLKVDKASMANSIEARVPFLDHKVVEFAYALNSEYKLRGKWFSTESPNEKAILRSCAKNYLPSQICQRKKQGFLLSVPDLMSDNMDKIKQRLLSPNSFAKIHLDNIVSGSLFRKNKLHILEKQRLNLIWKLYLLELWHQNVFSNAVTHPRSRHHQN
ncbi:putative Asparagine synthetase [uncultured Woeseiaceae bacterium]|uniref:asparagine synthase (glutamine-hydrolyzing) n=1 Tax=uncultured Woeseiaceae bacterium TaxID=1983305 RepID=A0A7D9D4G2_9GAMM|nr:putative Asparagine synthetase [uncultured Woeseiaceae bacterium]